MPNQQTLFARTEHGGHPVHLLGTEIRVDWPSGAQLYTSPRQTILALVNRNPHPPKRPPNGLKWSFERYFKIGRYQAPEMGQLDILELFKPRSTPHIQIRPRSDLGIDLAKRGKEVRRLFFAGFAKQIVKKGFDPEDVLQEIYKGILIRNLGKCPFDPMKSSFGHYVHMVSGCILSNYYRRYGRLQVNELYGASSHEGEIDFAESEIPDFNDSPEENLALKNGKIVLARRAAREATRLGLDVGLVPLCLEHLVNGVKQKEMTNLLGRPPSEVSKIVKIIKRIARGESEVSRG